MFREREESLEEGRSSRRRSRATPRVPDGCPSSQDTALDARPGSSDVILVMAALSRVLGPISSVFFTDSL